MDKLYLKRILFSPYIVIIAPHYLQCLILLLIIQAGKFIFLSSNNWKAGKHCSILLCLLSQKLIISNLFFVPFGALLSLNPFSDKPAGLSCLPAKTCAARIGGRDLSIHGFMCVVTLASSKKPASSDTAGHGISMVKKKLQHRPESARGVLVSSRQTQQNITHGV